MAQTSTPSAPTGGTAGILKIVAGITAVISLGLAIRQVVVYTTDYRVKKQRLTALISTSKLQADGGDFAAAWTSLNQALRTDPDNHEVWTAREDLAQNWLDHSRTGSYIPTLTALADTLSPTLAQGILRADSIRKADLLAHMGWGDFLRWREGQRSLEPPSRYQASLNQDPRNPYALAMLAHWMIWQGIGFDSARVYFDTALNQGRARDYVRDMQIAAWSNPQGSFARTELLRIANQMRAGNEKIGDDRDQFWRAYNDILWAEPAERSRLSDSVPARDLLTTYHWAFDGTGYAESQRIQYQANLARLQELSGDRDAAAKGYRAILAEKNLSLTLRDRLNQALAELKR